LINAHNTLWHRKMTNPQTSTRAQTIADTQSDIAYLFRPSVLSLRMMPTLRLLTKPLTTLPLMTLPQRTVAPSPQKISPPVETLFSMSNDTGSPGRCTGAQPANRRAHRAVAKNEQRKTARKNAARK
jgi:hypothetical protein